MHGTSMVSGHNGTRNINWLLCIYMNIFSPWHTGGDSPCFVVKNEACWFRFYSSIVRRVDLDGTGGLHTHFKTTPVTPPFTWSSVCYCWKNWLIPPCPNIYIQPFVLDIHLNDPYISGHKWYSFFQGGTFSRHAYLSCPISRIVFNRMVSIKPFQDRSPVLGTNYLEYDWYVPKTGLPS